MIQINFRPTLTLVCSRVTLAAFLATLPGPSAWALLAKHRAPLPVITGLRTPSLTAPRMAVVNGLRFGAVNAAELLQPNRSVADIKEASGRSFAEAGTAGASNVFIAGGAPAIVPSRLAKSSAVTVAAKKPSVVKNWAMKARPYLPRALAVAGLAAASWALHHFGVHPGTGGHLLAALGVAGAGAFPSSGDTLRKWADTFYRDLLRPRLDGGQIVTKADLVLLAKDITHSDSDAVRVIDILAADGRLLSLGQGRYAFNNLLDRFHAPSGDAQADAAVQKAHEAVLQMNGSSDVPTQARAISTLVNSLSTLKDRNPSAADTVKSLLNNSALELLRILVTTVVPDVRRKSRELNEPLNAKRLLEKTYYHGLNGTPTTLPPHIQASLETVLADRIPNLSADETNLKQIRSGLEVAYSLINPRNNSASPRNAGVDGLRQLADAFDSDLRRTAQGGQLKTKAELLILAEAITHSDSDSLRVIDILAANGRLLSLGGNYYVFSDLMDRFSAASGDTEADNAGWKAHESVKWMNRSSDVLTQARAISTLADSLDTLKKRDAAAAQEVEILLNNSALELLRALLNAIEPDIRRQDQEQNTPGSNLALKKLLNAKRLLEKTHYFGLNGTPLSFPADTQVWLETLIGDRTPNRSEDETNFKQIRRGLEVVYGLLTAQNNAASPSVEPVNSQSYPVLYGSGFKPLPEKAYPFLSEFGTDVTRQAAAGTLDPMVGREAELDELIQTLIRRKKNNPLLVGEPGVGKTALIEGLAQMIVAGKIPELAGRNVVSLDLSAMVAGTKYRGQFEERVKAVIAELQKSNGQVLVFIDELHMLVGSGAAAGGDMDGANMFKPALSNGSISVIGATTQDERKTLEKDKALWRRFNPITLEAPSAAEAETILTQAKKPYEDKHGAAIGAEAIKAAVTLAVRYLRTRQLPDSAFDLIDAAGARMKMDIARGKRTDNTMTAQDVAEQVARQLKIPAGLLKQDDLDRLRRLPEELKGMVASQDRVIDKVARTLQAAKQGFRRANGPMMKFLLLGKSGVGKTETAHAIAQREFLDKNRVTRLDMSDYMEKFSVSRLTGAPPGYVGHDEEGALTGPVRKQPYQVIIFDEVEKAHPDVFKILLQVLQEGELRDAQNRVVDFRNTIIIMTSNLGVEELKKRGLGFETSSQAETSQAQERTAKYIASAKNFFLPELIGRLGENNMLVFEDLTRWEQLEPILAMRMEDLNKDVADKGLSVTLTAGATERIKEAALAGAKAYGARPLRDLVLEDVNDSLSQAFLAGRIRTGDKVLVDWDPTAKEFRADKAP